VPLRHSTPPHPNHHRPVLARPSLISGADCIPVDGMLPGQPLQPVMQIRALRGSPIAHHELLQFEKIVHTARRTVLSAMRARTAMI
jgi:hypothetical protein